MTVEQSGPFCGKCDRNRTDDGISITLPRPQCPDCGATSLSYKVKVAAGVTAHTSLGLKNRRPNESKPTIELKQGASYNRDNRRWLEVEQIVDRQNNRYKKKIMDPHTGEILRDDDGKLSDHQGFGDAKYKKKKPE